MNDEKYDAGLGHNLDPFADYLILNRNTVTLFSRSLADFDLDNPDSPAWAELDFSGGCDTQMWEDLGRAETSRVIQKIEETLAEPLPSYPIFQHDNGGHLAYVNHLTDAQLSGFFEAEFIASIVGSGRENLDTLLIFQARASQYIYVMGVFTEGAQCRVVCVIRPQDKPISNMEDSEFIDEVIASLGFEELPNALHFSD